MWTSAEREANKRDTIEGNVRRRVERGLTADFRPLDLNEAEIDKATEIGMAAWVGQRGNGEAADIGIDAVRRLRK